MEESEPPGETPLAILMSALMILAGYADASLYYFGRTPLYVCPLCLNVDTFLGTPLLGVTRLTLIFGTANALVSLTALRCMVFLIRGATRIFFAGKST